MICGPITHLQFLLNLRVNWTQIKKMIFKPNRPSVRFVCWSVVSLPFFGIFSRLCNQYLLRNDQRMSKIPQSAKGSWFPVRCPKVGFSSQTVDPNLSRQYLTKCLLEQRRWNVCRYPFLGWGPLRWSTNSSWDFTNSSWNFINSSWNFINSSWNSINSSWNFGIHSE